MEKVFDYFSVHWSLLKYFAVNRNENELSKYNSQINFNLFCFSNRFSIYSSYGRQITFKKKKNDIYSTDEVYSYSKANKAIVGTYILISNAIKLYLKKKVMKFHYRLSHVVRIKKYKLVVRYQFN